MKKTRYFVLTAAGILTAGLTTGLVASYLGAPVALTSQAGPNDLAFVPPDAAMVAYADVQQVMASELRQRLRKLEPDAADRNEFEEKTGVDVERDIDSIVAAFMPDGARDDHDGRPLVVARGRFDQVRIEGLAREHGGEVADYQGTRVIAHSEGERSMALGFLEPGVVAVGNREAVHAAIDARRSGRNVLSNTEMMRLVSELDASNAWAVGRFDAVAGRSGLPGGLQEKMPSLSWFSASGHLNGGITGMLKAEAKDEEAARNMRDMLRGIVAMVRLQADGKPELRGLMDSLQLGGEGKTIALGFSVPIEALDALDAIRGQRQRRGDAR